MASVSSLSNSSASQYALQRQSQQARQDVARAEEAARALRRQADDARRVADAEQVRADMLAAESNQAQANAAQARQRFAAIGSIINTTA